MDRNILFFICNIFTLTCSILLRNKGMDILSSTTILTLMYGYKSIIFYYLFLISHLILIYLLKKIKFVNVRVFVLIFSLSCMLCVNYWIKVVLNVKGHNICGPLMVLLIKIYHIGREWDSISNKEIDTDISIVKSNTENTFRHSENEKNVVKRRINEKSNFESIEDSCDNQKYSRTSSSIILKSKFSEIMHYVFCIPSILAGPACTYKEYKENKVETINYRKGIIKLSESIIYLIFHLIINKTVKKEIFLDDNLFIINILYLIVFGFGYKSKYYFIWKWTEAQYIFYGYDNMENIKPIQSELSADMKELANSWNIFTNKWLKIGVFDELKNKSVYLASAATFVVSSIWHGPKLGYFQLFIGFFFAIMVIKSNKKILESFHINSYIIKLIGIIQTNLTVNYLIIAFSMIETRVVFNIWKKLYFFIHLWILAGLGIILIKTLKK